MMLSGKGNRRFNMHGWESDFRRYRILVKIFKQNKIEQQNLEIFTTGLPQLLELRRIHNIAFTASGFEDLLDCTRNN
jgi:hypothetical protein